MWRALSFSLAVSILATSGLRADDAAPPAAGQVRIATSRITHVTVYQSDALVTREVDVPEGVGAMELVVTPLPAQAVNSSLYSEGGDGIRVMNTRFRTRALQEDRREGVR